LDWTILVQRRGRAARTLIRVVRKNVPCVAIGAGTRAHRSADTAAEYHPGNWILQRIIILTQRLGVDGAEVVVAHGIANRGEERKTDARNDRITFGAARL
jgi:hypothetical protein